MSTTDTTIHDDDFYDRHHDDDWTSPGIIIPIVAGVAIFIIALAVLYSYSRRRRYVPYPAYPVPPGTRIDPSEAPESTYVEGQHQENPDYEAGYVEEHHDHHHHPQKDGNYSPSYGEQYYHHHDDGYGHSGASRQSSPGGYGSGGYEKR